MYIYNLAHEVIIITRVLISHPSWEDIALDVIVLSVKGMDVTSKTHSG